MGACRADGQSSGMRGTILAIGLLVAACGGGSDDDVKIERTPSSVPGVWIKICHPGQLFCTLTVGSCDSGDASCTVCDPNRPLSQC